MQNARAIHDPTQWFMFANSKEWHSSCTLCGNMLFTFSSFFFQRGNVLSIHDSPLPDWNAMQNIIGIRFVSGKCKYFPKQNTRKYCRRKNKEKVNRKHWEKILANHTWHAQTLIRYGSALIWLGRTKINKCRERQSKTKSENMAGEWWYRTAYANKHYI